MKIFISQPMTGIKLEQIKDTREDFVKNLKEKYGDNIEILDTIFDDFDPEDPTNPLKCLGLSLYIMGDADLCVFMPNWQNSRGCNIEHDCAIKYGKTIEEY